VTFFTTGASVRTNLTVLKGQTVNHREMLDRMDKTLERVTDLLEQMRREDVRTDERLKNLERER